MRTKRAILAVSVVSTGLLGFADASAQQGQPGAAAQSNELTEIVVTAERRTENLQDVPITVSVLTSDSALKAHVWDNMTLQTQVPGLLTSRQNTGATMYMRGVGTIAAPGVENAIAQYVDDVYISGFAGNILSFNNIERVEVLKGPQGTLFGRNATGGVINIVTKNPSSDPALDVNTGYGNFRTIETSVYGTTGIGPNLAVNLAYHSREQDEGWGRDFTTGQDVNLGKEWGLRGKLLWTPSEGTSVLFSADHYWDNYDYGLNQTVVPGTLSADYGTFAGNYNTLSYNPFSPYGPGRSGQERHLDTESLVISHEFDWATLKSISARREVTNYTTYSQAGGPYNYNDARWPQHLEQYSEELHLSSPKDAQLLGRQFHWLAGIYLLKLNDSIDLFTSGEVTGGSVFQITPYPVYDGHGENYTKSYSAFYDATLEVASGTNLTLGVRETEDRIRYRSYSFFDVGAGATNSFFTDYPDGHANASKPTFRAVLDHKFLEDVMAYVSYSRGFKSGGFGLFAVGAPPALPEEVNAYIIGLKSDWFDHRFRANLEAFDYDYKHQQVEVIEGGSAVETNAASSRIYGLDTSLTMKPIEKLTLFANFEYLHGRYASFPGAITYVQNPATCTPVPHQLPGALQPGNLQCAFDASGKPTIRSPSFSGDIGFDYVLFAGDRGAVDWTANYYHTASFNWDPSGQFPEPAFGLISTSINWTSPGGKYDAQLWCSNCGNTYHDTFIAESGPDQQKAPEAPREFGVRFGAHFK
jgi:iron complex outermembrane receptor protein